MDKERFLRKVMAELAGTSIGQSLVTFALYEILKQGGSIEDAREVISKSIQNVDAYVQIRIEQTPNGSDLLMDDFPTIRRACLNVLNQHLSAWK